MTTKQTELTRLVTKIKDELSKPAFLERVALKYVINDQRIEHLPYKAALKRHYFTVFRRLLEIFVKNADHIGWRPATGAYTEARQGLKPEKAMAKPEFEKAFFKAINGYLNELLEAVKKDVVEEERKVRWAQVKQASLAYSKTFLSSNLVLTELAQIAHDTYVRSCEQGLSQSVLAAVPSGEFVRRVPGIWLNSVPSVDMENFQTSMANTAEGLLNDQSITGYHETRLVITEMIQYCERMFSGPALTLLSTQMSGVVGLAGVKEYLESDRGYSWLEVNLCLMGFGVTPHELKLWLPGIRSYLLDLVEIRLMGGAIGPDRAYDQARIVHLTPLAEKSAFGFTFMRFADYITEHFNEIMSKAEHRMPPVELTPTFNDVPLTPAAMREIVQGQSFTLNMSELKRLMKLSKLPDSLDPRSEVRLTRNGRGELQFVIDL